MIISTEAIVLAVIKYNDTDAILKTYTAQTGFISFFIKGYFKGNKARQKKALFQPNAIIEIQFHHKNTGGLAYLKDAGLIYHYKNLNFDFDKLNVSTFLREVLLESLKNEQADIALFNFIKAKFIILDQQHFSANFHLEFLFELTEKLGFSPDLDTNGDYFDLVDGCFTNHMPLGPYLNKPETSLFKYVSGMIFAAKKIKLEQGQRKKLIDILMQYYVLHIAQFKIPKSLTILNQIYE